MYKIYTDAAVNPKTKKSGAGVLIIHDKKQYQFKFDLQTSDNHLAEFQAAVLGFQELIKMTTQDSVQEIVFYYTDSKLIDESLIKMYAKHYQEQLDQLAKLQTNFDVVVNNWIPEKSNNGAHKLALQALRN